MLGSALSAAGCSSVGPARADEAPRIECTAGLEIELLPQRRTVSLGVPVFMIASLRNCSTAPVELPFPLDPEFGFLTLWMQDPGAGDWRKLEPQVRRGARGKRTPTLAPGEIATTRVAAFLSSDGWTMKTPGPYRVRAEYAADDVRVRSQFAEVDVREPTRVEERQAAELMTSREAASYLYLRGGEHLAEGRRGLETILKQYGDTYLAPYARVALATPQTAESYDSMSNSVRAPRCDAAVAELRRAFDRLDDAIFAADVVRLLRSCLERLGRQEEANAWVDRYLARYPEARTIPGLVEQAREVGRR